MRPAQRYIMYFLIGVILYYVLEAKEGEEGLDQFHDVAPGIILILVIALVIVKIMKERQNRKK